jgi:putative MATE family efflux protein
MMRLAGAKEDTLGPASGYFRIMSIGIAVQAISTSICAAQRGIGNTRVTMVCNLTANVTNIILCYLLIGGNLGFPQLGVNGAAIAMVGGFAVSMVMAFLSLLRKDAYLRISFRDSWKPDIPMIKSILHIGVGSMIEQVALRVGFFVYARVVADLGTASFAAHQIASQLMVLSFTFAEGIGVATTSLVGQNLGKNRPDLSIMYGKIGQRMAIAIAVCISIISIVARHFFASLFTSDKAIIDLTANIVLILAMILPVQTSHIVMGGSLRGAGDVKYVAFTMLMTVTIIRPVFSIVMVYVFHLGLIGAWVAMVFDQVVRMILLFRRFSKGKWIGIDV